jgi:hypothetical protein
MILHPSVMISPQQRVLMMSEFSDKAELFRFVENAGGWHEGMEEYIKFKKW